MSITITFTRPHPFAAETVQKVVDCLFDRGDGIAKSMNAIAKKHPEAYNCAVDIHDTFFYLCDREEDYYDRGEELLQRAALWADCDFQVEAVESWCERGIVDPLVARRLADAGIEPLVGDLAAAAMAAGVDLESAHE